MTGFSGRCLCGASHYEVSEPPKFAIRCYCSDCQKVSGGAGAPQLAAARAAVHLDGPLRTYDATSAKGNALGFGFCGACGSPIFKTTAMAPDLIFIYAGSLDDPAIFPAPREVFTESRPEWDKD